MQPGSRNPFDAISLNNQLVLKGDIKVLTSGHLPDEFPHRENEITRMVNSLGRFLKGLPGTNLIIYGGTGSGKTSVTKYVAGKLKEKMKDQLLSIYINCQANDSIYSIMVNMANSVSDGEKIPQSGWTIERIIDYINSRLENKKISLLIIMDEIDKLINNNGENALYIILNILRESNILSGNLIGITNDATFFESLDVRIKSRLTNESILFPPYNAAQLSDILRQRISMVLDEKYYDDSVVNLCAAVGAQEHGDARKSIDLMRTSIEIALMENSEKITTAHVNKARTLIESNIVKETISHFPIHEKITLLSAMVIDKMRPNSGTVSDVTNVYNSLCQKISIQPLSSRRIRDLISDMEESGLISTTVKSLGRYGRTKYIKLCVNSSEIRKIMEEDENIREILKFADNWQQRLID